MVPVLISFQKLSRVERLLMLVEVLCLKRGLVDLWFVTNLHSLQLRDVFLPVHVISRQVNWYLMMVWTLVFEGSPLYGICGTFVLLVHSQFTGLFTSYEKVISFCHVSLMLF